MDIRFRNKLSQMIYGTPEARAEQPKQEEEAKQ